jgi:hypothetical protein
MCTCVVLGLAAGTTRGGDDVVFRGEAMRMYAVGGEREASPRCMEVWMVTHGYRGGLVWVKNQSPLCQMRFWVVGKFTPAWA